MSKTLGVKNLEISYGCGYVSGSYMAERLVGNIMPIIEATGMKQEEVVKGLIKNAIYEIFHKDSVYIAEDLYTAICKVKQKIDKTALTDGLPSDWVSLDLIKKY